MIDDQTVEICPFDREYVGRGAAVLLRSNAPHVKRSVRAIRRRTVPAWSADRCDFAVVGGR